MLSIFIGILSGLLVVCFRMSIEWLRVWMLGSVPHPGQYRLLLAPMLVGLLLGLMVKYLFPQARGSGINQTKAALYIYNGYISVRTMIGKFITSALAIGSGHSLGPEDPSLQIGAGIASLIGRRLHLSRERLRLFAPVGAAAGLAAAFNAPISAILFVIEEVIGAWSAAVLGSIVLAAVSSVVIARYFWGSQPMFHIPPITLRDNRELLAYAVLGIVGGFAAVLFSRLLATLRPWLRSLPKWTQVLQPGAAGLIVGAVGFFGFPQVMGCRLQHHRPRHAWGVSLACPACPGHPENLRDYGVVLQRYPGGMFAPTLFIGAMLGASVGSFEKHFFPRAAPVPSAPTPWSAWECYSPASSASHSPASSWCLSSAEITPSFFLSFLPTRSRTSSLAVCSRFQSSKPSPCRMDLNLPSMEEVREETALRIEDALRPFDGQVFVGSDPAAVIAARNSGRKGRSCPHPLLPQSLVRSACRRFA